MSKVRSRRQLLKQKHRGQFGLIILFGAFLLVLARCGQAPSNNAPASGTFGSVYSIIQNNNCLECHTPTGLATTSNGVKVDFTSQTTAYSTLTGTNTVLGSVSKGNCGTVKLVTANSPTKSYLAGVIFSDYNIANFAGVTGCTTYYNSHSSNFNIKASDEASIIAWINNGAPNN